jgi:hypothetical protein
MEDVNSLARRGTLKIEEPVEIDSPLLHFPELGIVADPPTRSGPVCVYEHEVLIHLNKAMDYSDRSDGSPDSHKSYHSDVSGVPSKT